MIYVACFLTQQRYRDTHSLNGQSIDRDRYRSTARLYASIPRRVLPLLARWRNVQSTDAACWSRSENEADEAPRGAHGSRNAAGRRYSSAQGCARTWEKTETASWERCSGREVRGRKRWREQRGPSSRQNWRLQRQCVFWRPGVSRHASSASAATTTRRSASSIHRDIAKRHCESTFLRVTALFASLVSAAKRLREGVA